MIAANTARDNAWNAGWPRVHLIEAAFGDGTQRFCTWYHDLTWNSNTWTGTGAWEQPSQIAISSGTDASEMALLFSGVDTALLDDISNDSRGKLLNWYIGVINGQFDAADIAGVYTFLTMRMAPGAIRSFERKLTVELRLRPLTDAARVRAISVYSDADQRGIDANDDCFIDAGVLLEQIRSEFIVKSGFK